jgi:hypothetical protein
MARPKGVRETKPRATATSRMKQTALANGLTPLDIMIATAHLGWQIVTDAQKAGKPIEEVYVLAKDAAAEASKAAPYIHARKTENNGMTADEWRRAIEVARSEAANRGLGSDSAGRPLAGTLPN